MGTAVISSVPRSRKKQPMQVRAVVVLDSVQEEKITFDVSKDTALIGQLAGMVAPVLTEKERLPVSRSLMKRYGFTELEIRSLVSIYSRGYYNNPRRETTGGPGQVNTRLSQRAEARRNELGLVA